MADCTPSKHPDRTEELVLRLVCAAGGVIRTLSRESRYGRDFSLARALRTVGDAEPVTVGEFARHYACTQPAASQMLSKLEEDGLVTRSTVEGDARVRTFALTKRARRTLRDIRDETADYLAPAFDGLSDDDLAVLDRLVSGLENRVDETWSEILHPRSLPR